MTPAERQRLADAMTAMTGERWIDTGHSVERTVGERVGVYRDDYRHSLQRFCSVIYTGGGSFPYKVDTAASSFFGRLYTGPGWMDRFVADAVIAVRGHDAWVREQARAANARHRSERDSRRANAYRAILRPESNASESERAQARAHLERLGG
jgi:hypothetical protein